MLMLRIGGVAEHYNLPWHLLAESGNLSDSGIEIQWRNCPGGTGEMTQLLEEEALDMAILLTEGMVASCMKGNRARIVKVFVNSSLEWGVHTSVNAMVDFSGSSELVFAVSRIGSGSHLMALLYAQQKGIPMDKLRFEEVGSLDGAMKAFEEGRVQVFLWERYTTEPYCELHAIQRVDSIDTPWPCFVAAVRPDFYERYQPEFSALFKEVFDEASKLKHSPTAIAMIADRYGLPQSGVRSWFDKVTWGEGENLSLLEVKKVVDHLQGAGGLSITMDPHEVLLGTQLSV